MEKEVKPRELWIYDPGYTDYRDMSLVKPEANALDYVHFREVTPEREAAIQKMVEALEEARGWCVTHQMQTYSKLAGESVNKIDEAFEAWKKANE